MNEQHSKHLADELAQIANQSNGKVYQRGEMIYQPGDPDDAIYYIKQGKVKLAYLDESGRRLTLAILGEGQIFGELALIGEKRRELLAQVLQDAVIYKIDKHRLLRLIEQKPHIALDLIEVFARRAREIERKLEDLVFKDIETRLSKQLLKLIDEHGEDTQEGVQISFKITHKELADLIGSARENTTSALNRLAKEGILDKKRYQIIVKDEEKLKALSRNC